MTNAAVADAPVLAGPVPPERPLGLIETLRRLRRDGVSVYGAPAYVNEILEGRMLFQRFCILNKPEYVQHVLLDHQANYVKGRLTRQILGPALGQGLLTSEGDFWRRQRRIAAPAFHHRRLRAIADLMSACTAEALAELEAHADTGRPIDIMPAMMRLTMRIVARALFSQETADTSDELGAAITAIIEHFGNPSPLDLLGLPEWLPRRRDPAALRGLETVDRFIYGTLARRRAPDAGEAPDDLLSMLLEARDQETGEGMSDRQLRDEILTLFAAGHETTAVALTWTWYLLALHPRIERELHDEVDAALGHGPAGFGDLEALDATRRVFEESMRIYPPVFSINRVAVAPDRIGEHAIAPGTMMVVSPWLSHRNPKIWPDPLRFDPARFRAEQVRARHKYAYFPFGGGPRVCIGNAFALIEGRIILASLARRFRLRLQPGHPVDTFARITIRPRYGLKVLVEKR